MSASTAIPARCALGDDALQPEFGGGLKEPGTVTSRWSLDWIGERGSGLISFRSAALLSMSGVLLGSWPSKSRRSKAKNTISDPARRP